MRRALLILFGAILVPVLAGTTIAISNFRELLLHTKPTGIELPTPLPVFEFHPKRLKVAIVTSNAGTEVLELLGIEDLLAASGAFDTYTVAVEKVLSPTTGALAFLPDFTFDTAPAPDLVILPAILDPEEAQTLAWLKKQNPRFILSVCEGARVASAAGLTRGLDVTTHFLALADLEASAPETHWSRDKRVLFSAKFGSTAGVTASLDGTLDAIEKLAGREARLRAEKVYFGRTGFYGDRVLTYRDGLRLFFRAAFDWFRPSINLWIKSGDPDLSVAAALDFFARTQSFRVTSVGETPKLIQLRSGLWVAPLESVTTQLPATYEIQALNFGGEDPLATALHFVDEKDSSQMADFVARVVEMPSRRNGPFLDSANLTANLRRYGVLLFLTLLGAGVGNWVNSRMRPEINV